MFEVLRAQGGYYWRLKAANGQTLCHSEVYETKQGALNGILAAKSIAASVPVHDRT